MRQSFIQSLAAVLVGNLIYFWLLTPFLPRAARHAPFRFDLGLLLDAWVCLVVYGLLEFRGRARRTRR